MLTRVALLFFVIVGLCTGAYSLGGAATAVRDDSGGIPAEHPIGLALRFRQELALSNDQVTKLEQLRGDMAKEFAPIREKAESLKRRMKELQDSGKQDEEAVKNLQKEGEGLGATMKPLMERYAHSAGDLLSPEQREKMMKLSEAHAQHSDASDFPMMFIIESREQLGINPQQFTKLQYLQADFIRAFAPLREQMEMLQIEIQEKDGGQPSQEHQASGESIQGKVKELQAKFSERAVQEVLDANQRTKLEELLRGQHRSAPTGK